MNGQTLDSLIAVSLQFLVCDKLSDALIYRRLIVDTIKSNSDLKQLEQFQCYQAVNQCSKILKFSSPRQDKPYIRQQER